MRVKRLATNVAVAGLLTLALPASALAANSGSISGTGPSSTNSVTIDNDQTTTIVNAPTTTVTNSNTQTATSGPATVSGNTTGGSATTGTATNNNSFSTNVSGTGVGGGLLPGGAGGGSLPGGGGSLSGGAGGGSLAAATSTGGGLGGGSLPDTGALFPIDVSALRNVLGSSQDVAAVNRARGLSVGLLAAAALMSLLGATGSAVYAAKKQREL